MATIAPTQSSLAESLYLKDGTVVEGSIIHMYGDSLHLVLASGDTLTLSRNDLIKIVFTEKFASKKSKAIPRQIGKAKKGPFRTPTHTFSRWKQALIKGDLETMASCFSTAAQPGMLAKLKSFNKQQRKQMRDVAKKTEYSMREPQFRGDHAFLQVTRAFNGKTETDLLEFVLENEQWKMLPQ